VVELAPPQELWTRWAALAAALTTVGHDDVWTAGPDGAHHDDHGGNWSHLSLIEGGRAVLYGYDHEYSDTVMHEPAIDLLAGAPDWLPWDALLPLAGTDELGYVYWHDGTGWARADYDAADGLTATAGQVLDDDAALTELGEFVFEWGQHEPDTAAERDRVAGAGRALLAAARARRVDGTVLSAYAGKGLEAGLAVAVAGGLTPEIDPPRVAAGRRPGTRAVRKLSDSAHDKLVWEAMKTAAERPRPAPAAGPELAAVQAYAREHGPVTFTMTNSSASGGGKGIGFEEFRRLQDLVRALRDAESHPEHGRWFFVRVEADAVERRYDSWPSWFEDTGYSGPWRSDLAEEIGARAPQWRPEWTALLDPAIARGTI
jgi:hypothetical protein